MDMEKYSRLVDEFAEANCHVKEEDIVRKVHSGNKRHFKAFVGAAACVALIFIGTTVSAASGLLDVNGLFKKLFSGDDISSKLIDEGAVQELGLSAQDEKYTVTFEGLTGDSNTQFGVFKLVDHNGELGDPSLIQIDVKMVGMSEVEEGRLSNYYYLTNKEFSVSDEEDNTYYIKVYLPSRWISYSPEELYVSFEKVRAYYGDIEYWLNTNSVKKADRSVEIDFDLKWTFTPDNSVLPASYEFDINEVISSEYGDFTVKSLEVSRYDTGLIITFPTNENIIDVHDATALWHKFDNDFIYEPLSPDADVDMADTGVFGEYKISRFSSKQHKNDIERDVRYVKTVTDPTKYMEGEVKLFVNGNEIKRMVNTAYRWASGMDSEINPTVWGNVLNFEPFDLQTAETIEIRYKDQTIKVK